MPIDTGFLDAFGPGQVAAYALFLAAVDTIWAVVVAIVSGNFSPQHVLDFLIQHVLKIVAPIELLAMVGHGIPAIGIPALPAATLAAILALAAYLPSVVASVRDTYKDKAAIA